MDETTMPINIQERNPIDHQHHTSHVCGVISIIVYYPFLGFPSHFPTHLLMIQNSFQNNQGRKNTRTNNAIPKFLCQQVIMEWEWVAPRK
jgi:hypothetical protein